MAQRLHRTSPSGQAGFDRIDFQLPPLVVSSPERRQTLFRRFQDVYDIQKRVAGAQIPGAENWLPVHDWTQEGEETAHYRLAHCDHTGDMYLGEKAFTATQCHRLATQLVQALRALQATVGRPHGDLLLRNGELNREAFAFGRHRGDDFGRLLLAWPLPPEDVSGPAMAQAERADLRAVGAFVKTLCLDSPTLFGKDEGRWTALLRDLAAPKADLTLDGVAARLAPLRPVRRHPILWLVPLLVLLAAGGWFGWGYAKTRYLFDPMPYYRALKASAWLGTVGRNLDELAKEEHPPGDGLRSLLALHARRSSWDAYGILTEAEKDNVEGMELGEDGSLAATDARRIRHWVRAAGGPARQRLDALVGDIGRLEGFFAAGSPLAADVQAARDRLPPPWHGPREYLGRLADADRSAGRGGWLAEVVGALRIVAQIETSRSSVVREIEQWAKTSNSAVVPKLQQWFDSLAGSGEGNPRECLERIRDHLRTDSSDRRAFNRVMAAVKSEVEGWESLIDAGKIPSFEQALATKYADIFAAKDDALANVQRYEDLFEEWKQNLPRKEGEEDWWRRLASDSDPPTSIPGVNAVWRSYRDQFLGPAPAPGRYGRARVPYPEAKAVLNEFREALARVGRTYEDDRYEDGTDAVPVAGTPATQRDWKKGRDLLADASATAFVRAAAEILDRHGLPALAGGADAAGGERIRQHRRQLRDLDRYFLSLNAVVVHVGEFGAGRRYAPPEPPASVQDGVAAFEGSVEDLAKALADTRERGAALRVQAGDGELGELLAAAGATVAWLDDALASLRKLREEEATHGRPAPPDRDKRIQALLTAAAAADGRNRPQDSALRALRLCAWWCAPIAERDAVADHLREQSPGERTETLIRIRDGRRDLAEALAKAWPGDLADPDPTMRAEVVRELSHWVWQEFGRSQTGERALRDATDALYDAIKSVGGALREPQWLGSPGIDETALREYAPLQDGERSARAFEIWSRTVPDCVRIADARDRTSWEAKLRKLETEYAEQEKAYGNESREECAKAQEAIRAFDGKLRSCFAYGHLVERNRKAYESETSMLEALHAAAEKAVAGIMSPEKWLADAKAAALEPGAETLAARWTELRDGMLAGVTPDSLLGEANREKFRELRGRFAGIRRNMAQAAAALPAVEIVLEPPPAPATATEIRTGLAKARDGLLAAFLDSADARRPDYWQSEQWAQTGGWPILLAGMDAARMQAASLPQQLRTAGEHLARFHSLDQKGEGEQSLAEIRAAWAAAKEAPATVLAAVAEVGALRARLDALAEIAAEKVTQDRLATLVRQPATPPAERFAAWERIPAVSPDGWPSTPAEWNDEKILGEPFAQEPYAPVAERFRQERRRRWERALASGIDPATVVPEAAAFAVDDGYLAGRLGSAEIPTTLAVLRQIARLPAGKGGFPDASWRAWNLLDAKAEGWLTGADALQEDLDLAARQGWDAGRHAEWAPVARSRWQRIFAGARDPAEIGRLANDKAFARLADEAALDPRSLRNLRLARMKNDLGSLKEPGAETAAALREWLTKHLGERGERTGSPLGELSGNLWTLWEKAGAGEGAAGAAGLDKAGPAGENVLPPWTLAGVAYADGAGGWENYDGAREPVWLKYAGGAGTLVFRRVETDGKATYVCSTEVSVAQALAVLNAPGQESARWNGFWQTVADESLREAATGGDFAAVNLAYAEVPNVVACWQARMADGAPVALALRVDRGMPWLLTSKTSAWFDREEWVQAPAGHPPDFGEPSDLHPARWLSAASSLYVASLHGCRLPSAAEWRLAAQAPGGGDLRNCRDSTWAAWWQHLLRNDGLVMGQNEDNGNSRRELLGSALLKKTLFAEAVLGGAAATRRMPFDKVMAEPRIVEISSQPEQPPVLWFAPVGDDSQSMHYVLDNVAEYVCESPEDAAKALAEWRTGGAAPTSQALEQALAGIGFRVAGGSSLSPPSFCRAEGEPLAVEGTGPATGYADVGLRLAFSASPPSPAFLLAKAVTDAKYLLEENRIP